MESGFEALDEFRDAFTRTFGGGAAAHSSTGGIVVDWIESPLGPLLIGATDEAVCLLEFTERRRLETQLGMMRRRFTCAIVHGHNEHLALLRRELDDYFEG